jgi:hypothetical protein
MMIPWWQLFHDILLLKPTKNVNVYVPVDGAVYLLRGHVDYPFMVDQDVNRSGGIKILARCGTQILK